MVIKQYEVYLVNLDPIVGSEIAKIRPSVVVSPNEMNAFVQTVIIAPMTTKSHQYPTRIPLKFLKKTGWIVLDQIRTVDQRRLVKKIGVIKPDTITKLKNALHEMLVA